MPDQPGALENRLGIVIVTRNRITALLTTLGHLSRLEAPYPIVIVDNASTDGTSDVVRIEYPDIEVITLAENMGATARNHGVKRLERQFIAFADDDSWWAHGSLRRAVEIFDRHPDLGLIMSRVLVREEESLDPCCELMSRSPLPRSADLPGVPIIGFMGCGVVFRRQPFLDVGGFNESFRSGGEESIVAMDFAARGWQCTYIDSITSHHYPAERDNMHERRVEGVCVEIWLACLRRRPRHVARIAANQVRRALTRAEYRQGIRRAYPQIPRFLREREPIPHWLETQMELLEHQASLES
jgi:glycosyltransferase involved in cell wall biosynthesis